MTENIKEMIESMTTDEMKQRLAEYMAAWPPTSSWPHALLLLK